MPDTGMFVESASIYKIKSPNVDRVVYGSDWVKGYKDGVCVTTYGGVIDLSLIRLYDENGNLVKPVPAPPDKITQLQLALTELYEEIMKNG